MMLPIPGRVTSRELLIDWRPQIYQIQHTLTGMTYVGCVYSQGKLYLERFREHMTGASSGIETLIKRGIAKVDDEFICTLIEIVANPLDASTREQVFISGIPRHLSINYLVGSNQGFRSKIIEQFEQASDDGWCIPLKLSTEDERPLQALIIVAVSTGSDLYSLNKSFATTIGIITTKGWKDGRKNFRQRKSLDGVLTAGEIAGYALLPKLIQADWQGRSEEYVAERTSHGLAVMNTILTCEHCSKEISRGNYHRWHGEKCKSKA